VLARTVHPRVRGEHPA